MKMDTGIINIIYILYIWAIYSFIYRYMIIFQYEMFYLHINIMNYVYVNTEYYLLRTIEYFKEYCIFKISPLKTMLSILSLMYILQAV